MMPKVTVVFPLILVMLGLAASKTVHIKGKLTCPSDPSKAANLEIKLVDKDSGPTLGFTDDNMAINRTNANGEFYAWGKATDVIGSIEPRLKIYHRCNNGWNLCDRRWKIKVPSLYVTNDNAAIKVFDIGTWSLEAILGEEEKKCL